MKKSYRQYFKRKTNKVYYSLGTRCTWKEKLPTMNNSKYALLYGIAPSIDNLSLNQFKQQYIVKPIELFNNRDYVRSHKVQTIQWDGVGYTNMARQQEISHPTRCI